MGFDNRWAQGGLNTEGLAFDWVAGFKGSALEPKRKTVRGNPSEQMLRTCTSLDLKTGDIFIYRFQASDQPVKLSLAEELARPAHGYDLALLQAEDGGAALKVRRRSGP